MPSTAVVADTTSYLTPELLSQHDVRLVSLYVGIEGEQERESEIADLAGFYESLRTSDQQVTTSQPSVGDFISVYEPLLAEGREIVSIHLSSGISGPYESAMQARERLTAEGKGGERIVVCDSRTGAGGMGLMILGAANAAESGANAAEANEAAERGRAELKIWFAGDTLASLRRGGRIGAARAWIGTTLKIKPILTIEGEMQPVERVRTSGPAFERLVAHLELRRENGCDAFAIQHIQVPDVAERMAERGREIRSE